MKSNIVEINQIKLFWNHLASCHWEPAHDRLPQRQSVHNRDQQGRLALLAWYQQIHQRLFEQLGPDSGEPDKFRLLAWAEQLCIWQQAGAALNMEGGIVLFHTEVEAGAVRRPENWVHLGIANLVQSTRELHLHLEYGAAFVNSLYRKEILFWYATSIE